MKTINEAGQKWFFNNLVVPYFSQTILNNWDSVKEAWFQDVENCIMNTRAGDDVIYEINKQFTSDRQSFTFRIHDNFLNKYFY